MRIHRRVWGVTRGCPRPPRHQQTFLYCPPRSLDRVRVKDLDSHAIKALLVSRALLVKIKPCRDFEALAKMKQELTELHGTKRQTVAGSGILADMFSEQGGSLVRWLPTPHRTWNSWASRVMKMLAEYVEHAIEFERMADETEDGALKEQFLKQAEAYRKLAEKRAIQIGFRKPPPQSPQSPQSHPSN